MNPLDEQPCAPDDQQWTTCGILSNVCFVRTAAVAAVGDRLLSGCSMATNDQLASPL
jgi:hypothetical protein